MGRDTRPTKQDQQVTFSQVGRLGLEPRTHGLKVGWLAALSVLPAQMPHADERKAHIAQGCGRHSSHESSHGIQAGPAGFVTVSDGDCPGRTRAEPPLWRHQRAGRSGIHTAPNGQYVARRASVVFAYRHADERASEAGAAGHRAAGVRWAGWAYGMTTLAVNRSSWCRVPSGFWPVLLELSDQAG